MIGEQVIRWSLEHLAPTGCAVFLTKMAFLSTQKRSQLFVDRPPAEVWVLRARPSFTGDGHTDVAQEYAFTFFLGERVSQMMSHTGRGATHLHWLDNSRMMTKPTRQRVRIEKEEGDV